MYFAWANGHCWEAEKTAVYDNLRRLNIQNWPRCQQNGGQKTRLDTQADFFQDICQNLKLERQKAKKLIRKNTFPSKEIQIQI